MHGLRRAWAERAMRRGNHAAAGVKMALDFSAQKTGAGVI